MKNNINLEAKKKASLPAGKVALYDPYLDTLGGGEKHILSILKALEDHSISPYIFWDDDLSKDIKDKLNIEFKSLNFLPNAFRGASVSNKLSTLKSFDYFFYVTDGSYFVSTAKNNFVFAMVPKKDLYQLSILNKIKLSNYKFITNSDFTKNWLAKWGIKSSVIYPFVSSDLIKSNTEKKNLILNVGRFFGHLHSKKHDAIIQAFERLQQNKLFKNFKLILAGSVKKEDQEYFSAIRKLASKNPSIEIRANLTHQELLTLYQEALVYWHFTGFGIDEEKEPEKVEHLGIAPLEAMAAGCMTFCYRAGGPKEFIESYENGFLFTSIEELTHAMRKIVDYPTMQDQIQKQARKTISSHFTYSVFKQRVSEVILKT